VPGTTYHLNSLALATVVVSSATLACLAPALLRAGTDLRSSLRAWLVGSILAVSSDVLFFLELDALPFALLLALAGLGAAEWLHAVRLFRGPARRAVWPWFVVAIAAATCLASPSYPVHVVATSTSLGLVYLGAAWSALGIRVPDRSVGRVLLVAVFGLLVAVMAARLGLFVSGVRSGAPPGFTTPARALLFVLASIGPVAASFAFVLACGERLGDRLLRWSLTDSLTGLPNRRAFFDALDRTLAAGHRRRQPTAVLAIDLDEFKRVNDTAGHAAGDLALVEVARRLQRGSRSEDTVGRLGGEEFGLVLPDADREAATGAAERLRLAIASAPVVAEDHSFDLTVSIGFAVAEGDETSADVYARADVLLYEAKRLGRNRVAAAPS
jgi:diguanylate cyclase (GGDEF)-like protein